MAYVLTWVVGGIREVCPNKKINNNGKNEN
jgi:hypothetical protein